jgi:transcriptional regulator of arginine metabolism
MGRTLAEQGVWRRVAWERQGPKRVRSGGGGIFPSTCIFMQTWYSYAMTDKPRRHHRIVQLIQAGPVNSQEQLAAMLRQDGFAVTQATLSRDLRELGVMKGPLGYTMPGDAPVIAQVDGELQRALRTYLVKAESGGNLAVLHTGPGRAPLLALELDRARLKSVLGTVAGDDTIFIAARSSREAGRVLKQLRQMAGLR